MTSREIRLASRPEGEPQPSNFELAETDVPSPAEGQIVVRNTFMSVDPYMRGRMNDVKSYTPPWQLGDTLTGGALGEVVESNAPGFEAGDTVLHQLGWREVAVLEGKHAQKVVAPEGVAPSAFLGALGMPGLTAYVGLLDIAQLRGEDVVFVSGAAGAVGSIAGQIAKLRGHTVIGSAGSPEKLAWLRDELGFDAVFDYHDGKAVKLLAKAAPDGFDVYFDNVGGEQLEAAIFHIRTHGRIALCGGISGYNGEGYGIRNMMLTVGKRVTLRGFIITDHQDRHAAFVEEVGGYLRDGKLQFRETIVGGGVDAAPQAFIDLLRGANTGKMLVQL